MSVKRIYVEKRPGFFDIPAQKLCADLKSMFTIPDLRIVRIFRRYDIENITNEEFTKAKNVIFAEPPVDVIYDENLPHMKNTRMFAVEFLPGQFDQTADSAAQCVQLITQKERPLVRTAKIIALMGNIDDDSFAKIKKYCINEVECREASMEKPHTLAMKTDIPADVAQLENFIIMTDTEIHKLHEKLGLAMSYEDFLFCRKYFRDQENRNPTITEIRVIDTYWSDHCRHTTFTTAIDSVFIDSNEFTESLQSSYMLYQQDRSSIYDTPRPMTLMDLAVIGMKKLKKLGKLDDLDVSEEINACSIVVPAIVNGQKENWLVMFKNETHNHPTEIEPFGGAATCLGGAIRDPLSGRAYVYQAMRVTGAADPRRSLDETIEGKLPQRKITRDAAHGYSSYGNQIGLATGQVHEVYHDGFLAKRLEVGAVIGAVPQKNVVRKQPQPGDVIILVGGRTGRDGIGGATGSSKEHTVESLETCGAEVQKGNPPTERKLQRLFRDKNVSQLIKRCNDFGAGGVAVAIGELADGLYIELDRIKKKYAGLDGTELAISESQERMAVVVDKNDAPKFINYASAENLEATVVAVVTDNNRLRMVWREKTIVDISRSFLQTNGVQQHVTVKVTAPDKYKTYFSQLPSLKYGKDAVEHLWLENLQDLNVCNQKGLAEQFDSSIGAGTVLMPYGGYTQRTPAEGMAAKLPVIGGNTDTATLMSFGFDPYLLEWSPYHGAIYSIVAALAKITAMGGDYTRARLTLQEYFESLGTDPVKWGKPFAALLGALKAQHEFGTAAIGGKDSMSGTFMNLTVPPSLIAFAVCPVSVKKVISSEFKLSGNLVYVVPAHKDKAYLPLFDKLKANFTAIYNLIDSRKIYSAMSVGKGGIAATISKMCLGENIGFKFNDNISYDIPKMFGSSYGTIIIEVAKGAELSELKNTGAYLLGYTSSNPSIVYGNVTIALDTIDKAFNSPLESIFPTQIKSPVKRNIKPFSETANNNLGLEAEKVFATNSPSISPYSNRNFSKTVSMIYHAKKIISRDITIAKPKVFIPVFPGTNCEYDTQAAFERAGAKVEILVIRNLTVSTVEESVLAIEKAIQSSQIIMLPGGFSGGDEPDGSGKFIAATFRNPRIADAINKLLYQRDGLMLGICNGFQALIKLGLLPYGKIRDLDIDTPTLTYNEIGRHVSRMVQTKVVSNLSPWLSKVKLGSVHTMAVSHGEGRFFATTEVISQLRKKGQIATQYVDFEGTASMDIKYNPNGSINAIEGITSPDGRVFGKMGHSERITDDLGINVPGEKNQMIFESGVAYYR
ncbi:phosphoribosylformylglycinamidine synthase [Pectinatus sottacetonis]|uniref:phosphoribosylformylglycinamidine synthase n=1 Tax=Pectinatus sottacetonis TaxID=1002795 RepID=UPI0018C707B9|nr:phosphoribosylformylglycinamidine synthase [Pectinatus sottacetonis]